MSANALLSTIILVAFIVTVVLAIGSYAAYKVREQRRPRSPAPLSGPEPVFFERIHFQRPSTSGRPAGESVDVRAPH